MKKFLIALLALLVVVYAFLAFVGVEPQDMRPGTRLSGAEGVLPQDLAFVEDHQEVFLETRPWFGIPFSVTVVLAADVDRLYVPSLYETPQEFPGTKYWNKVVAANPEVRLKIGQNIYPGSIFPVTDDAEFRAAFDALGRKYPFWREQIELDGRLPRFALLRFEPASFEAAAP